MIINVAVLAIYIICLIVAYKNGFLYEALGLVINIVILGAAYFISPLLAKQFSLINIDYSTYPIAEIFDLNYLLNCVLWFFIAAVVLSIAGFIVKHLFKSVSDIPFLGFMNRILGLVIGFVNATVIALLISVFLSFPFISNGRQIKEDSILSYINIITDKAINYVTENMDLEKFARTVEDFDITTAREDMNKWLIEEGIFHE